MASPGRSSAAGCGRATRCASSRRAGRAASSRIVTLDGDLDEAVAGQSITITIDDEIDISRGDLVVAAEEPAEIADQFEATVVWMNEAPLLRGRDYLMKIGTKTVGATISPLKYKINVNTLEHVAAVTLELNDIGVCQPAARSPDRVRPLPGQPGHGRLHPGRPAIERHRRRRHAALRAAARAQRPLAGARREQEGARGDEGPEAVRALVHGSLRRRQVDDRQPGGQEAAQHEAAHLPARRRQRPSRHEQGSRVHRRGSRREHPPHRRDVEGSWWTRG